MSNFNFNKAIIGGRIASDLELKQTQSGISVISFRVAVNKKTGKGSEQATDFFTVVAWRGVAEMIATHLKKGSAVCVTGTLANVHHTDKDGNRRTSTEINAEEIHFVDSKSEIPRSTQDVEPSALISEVKEDGDLPF